MQRDVQEGDRGAGCARDVLEHRDRPDELAVSSGLLPGVFRRHFMTGTHVEVRPLTPEDVRAADRVCLANAVWGMVDVRLDESELPF